MKLRYYSTSKYDSELDKHINRYTAAVAIEEAAQKAASQDFVGAQKQLDEVIKLVQQSVSANNPQSKKYCEDLVADLKEVSEGFENNEKFTAGVHYSRAYSTMYYMERSTGTSNLQGVEKATSGKQKERQRNVGYGYKTTEQDKGATEAKDKQKHYVSGYLS